MKNDKTPLKDRPLRNPGQSIQDERTDILFDKFIPLVTAVVLAWLFMFIEWGRYFFSSPPHPWTASIVFVTVTSYAAWKIFKLTPKMRALKLAEDGEKVVGQYLEALRESGYRIFHDVVGQGFNIDHVIIGPAGIFTVETKTWNKPHSNAHIRFDGENLSINGLNPDRDPVIQAKAQASWLREILNESTGEKFAVRPVILFPGWYIDDSRENKRDLWVLAPKALPHYLENEKTKIEPESVCLAASHLAKFIRSEERTRDKRKIR
ncbi:MAG: Nuclease-related domain protein [Betaproteobacteria bacterium ADurb.Bin341]|nr:MAG: Nuclease-related domain protein [Betaproteobacteria bacterium ADurb.Bin341]